MSLTNGQPAATQWDVPLPWERQPGEPQDWHRRFCLYLHQGVHRTLRGAVQADYRESGKEFKSPRLPDSWVANADHWHWRQRAAAFDRHQRRQALRERRQEVAEAKQRHVAQANLLQHLAIQYLRTNPPMTPMTAMHFLDKASKLEARALGFLSTVDAVADALEAESASEEGTEGRVTGPMVVETVVSSREEVERQYALAPPDRPIIQA
jgi:hypothetical protein